MKLIIQILVAILVGLIINDTFYFLYEESSKFINKQIDVRDPYEAAEFRPFEPSKHITDSESTEDESLSWLWISVTFVIVYLANKARQRIGISDKTFAGAVNKDELVTETVNPDVPYQQDESVEAKNKNGEMSEELVEKPSVGSSLIVEPNVSFISTTYDSSRPSEIIASDTDDADASNVEFELRRVSGVPDFDSIFKCPIMQNRQPASHYDRMGADLSTTHSSSLGMSQTTNSSIKCDCNVEQFEERLGVVEHGLKQTEEATKEWAKRIEQSEVDLVNLNRQMYNVLSRVEFKAPNSGAISRHFKNSTSTEQDFSAVNSYKVDETSFEGLYTSDNNWATLMESEVERKINEIKCLLNQKIDSKQTDSIHLQQSKLTIPSMDENSVVREALSPSAEEKNEPGDTLSDSESTLMYDSTKDWTNLMKEEVAKKVAEIKQGLNAMDATDHMLPSLDGKADSSDEPLEGSPKRETDDLITKTLEIVKDIEDVVYKESPKMTKITPRVPTHVVPPYKRISFAETDGSVSIARNNNLKINRHKSKFK